MFYVSHSSNRQANRNATYEKKNENEGLSLKVKWKFVAVEQKLQYILDVHGWISGIGSGISGIKVESDKFQKLQKCLEVPGELKWNGRKGKGVDIKAVWM